ncbi:hypothetical protein [Staphylospora marina]|uniref:hypothetical protein n=1 Tax=Staphylospora marina TaxID=2490858 RepID=UPI000F5BA81D|nr:hypothetical protein [Staphylospora marina]
MSERLWIFTDPDLASLDVYIDREKISQVEIVHKVYEVARHFGDVTRVEIITESAGDDAYLEHIGKDEQSVKEQKPSDALISFVTNSPDVTDMRFNLGTYCVDETGDERWMAGAVTLSFWVDPNDVEWAFYINVNTDLFVPFRFVKDERTERMARWNAPKLKRLLEEILRTFPVVSWEWDYCYSALKEYLEQI